MATRWRTALDWILTIGGAIAVVLAIKAYVVNPYRIPSASMEPTLHCAAPEAGCEARWSDRVLANRFIYRFRNPRRQEIVVFKTPKEACGTGGTFVKRLIGLPGETIRETDGYVYVDGRRLSEPYLRPERRDHNATQTWHVPKGEYFFLGDNRVESCDSRVWGSIPRRRLIGKVFAVYWPPNRIDRGLLTVGGVLAALVVVLLLRGASRHGRGSRALFSSAFAAASWRAVGLLRPKKTQT